MLPIPKTHVDPEAAVQFHVLIVSNQVGEILRARGTGSCSFHLLHVAAGIYIYIYNINTINININEE